MVTQLSTTHQILSRGIGASSGVVSGKVRVVRFLSEISQVKVGNILLV